MAISRNNDQRGRCLRTQAQLWCTTSRAKKVVVGLTLVALTTTAVWTLCEELADGNTNFIIYCTGAVVFRMVLPVSVLVINVVVARQARRAINNAAASLGLQQHHQSTSVVPTVMLIITSLVYVLLYSTASVLLALDYWTPLYYDPSAVMNQSHHVANAVSYLVYAYNFYVYLITGKQFRSELKKLARCCFSSCSRFSSGAAVVTDEVTAHLQTETTV